MVSFLFPTQTTAPFCTSHSSSSAESQASCSLSRPGPGDRAIPGQWQGPGDVKASAGRQADLSEVRNWDMAVFCSKYLCALTAVYELKQFRAAESFCLVLPELRPTPTLMSLRMNQNF